MATMLTMRAITTTPKRGGFNTSIVMAANRMVNTDETNCGSPSCMAAETFSRSLVTRLMTSPVLWLSK